MARHDPLAVMSARLKQHRRWLAGGAEGLRADAIAHLRDNITERSLHSLRMSAHSVHYLALYYGALGVVAMKDGADNWREHVSVSCELYLAQCRIEEYLSLNDPTWNDLSNLVPKVACLRCFQITVERDRWGTYLHNFLGSMYRDTKMVSSSFWPARPFERFVLSLSSLAHGAATFESIMEKQSPIYSSVLSLRNGDALRESIQRACDFHCMKMRPSEGWMREFEEAPFDLIPWEIFAILKYRSDDELSTLNDIHPLISSTKVDGSWDVPVDNGDLRLALNVAASVSNGLSN